MAVDFAKLARDIVEQGGGPVSVKAVTHCMTRLRFVLKDDGKADMEAIKKIKGILGCVNANCQMQVVLGQNLVNTYNEVVKQFHFTEQAPIDEKLDEDAGTGKFDVRKLGKNIIGYITASVTPMIPGLIAGGMLKVVLLLVSLISPDFASSWTYTLLSIVANAPFYFLPIWIAYGAAAKLGGTPIYAMAVAAAMFAPDFLKLVSADPQVEQTLFGLPVLLKSYANGLFPALLLSFAAYEFERLWNKVVFAPLGTWIGEGIVFVLMAIYSVAGSVALAVLAASLPFLIMVGAHTVFSLFMVQLLQNPGYDGLFRPALLLHNMAEGAACLAVAARTKDAEFRSEAISIAIGCIVAGVTEPALYGITFRLKRPLYGVVAGGAAGGLVGGLLGMHAYIMGYSNILALPIFEDTIIAAAIAVAIVVPFFVTFILGFDEAAEA